MYELCKKDEVTCGYQLTEEVLECFGQDRQDTRLALRVFNDRTAALFRTFYSKNAESKMAAADYCDMIYKGRISQIEHTYKFFMFCHFSMFQLCPNCPKSLCIVPI